MSTETACPWNNGILPAKQMIIWDAKLSPDILSFMGQNP